MLSIGEVSQISGVRPSALRYYEDAGLISPVARISGRRHYEASVLSRLDVIACAQDAGFTIAEVRQLLGGEKESPGGWRVLAERKLREVDAVIEKAQATRRLLEDSLRYDGIALEDCATVVGEQSAEPSERARTRSRRL